VYLYFIYVDKESFSIFLKNCLKPWWKQKSYDFCGFWYRGWI